MPLPTTSFDFDEADSALGERLRKLAADTDQIEGYKQPHATRLAQLAEAVGQRFGLHSHDLVALKFAALAHGLGERKMRCDYLLRPSGLNWEEQLDLWRHPILGEQEAQELKLPRQTQLLVRWHHEWWNGTGYPDGLAGAAIPLGARILRAVDTYCALTADRPYRGGYEWQTAEQMLADQAGIECDPRVVLTLLSVLAAERHTLEMQQAAADPQSYETVQMAAVTVEASEWPAPVSNVIEMPFRETETPVSYETNATGETDATESFQAVLADAPTEALRPEEKTEEAVRSEPPPPSPITFDSPTLRPGAKPPAPPVPPPLPLWKRFAQPESKAATTPSGNLLSLDDGPDATPVNEPVPPPPEPIIEAEAVDLTSPTAQLTSRGFVQPPSSVTPISAWTSEMGNAPTEEVRALTPEELTAARTPTSPLSLASLTEDARPTAKPLTLVPSNHLQVVALSEVPDHFWLVAKWIYEEWWETPDNSISLVSNALKEHLASTTVPQTFVALIDGKPVGSISLVIHDVPERTELSPWLASLYVLPEHRRQGIGTRLLEGAFLRARLQGAEAVYLAAPAHAEFFARFGWQVLEREVGTRRLMVMMRVS